MNSRVNLRCAACGWYTSRAAKPDQDYGTCRCGAVLTPSPPRRYFQRASPPPAPLRRFNAWFDRKFGDGHTWPELVAAELERQEEQR